MKYLGVDYGEKNIGLATSDSLGRIAFPFSILKNGNDLWVQLEKIIQEEKIEAVVLGKSFDLSGGENPIEKQIEIFGKEVQERFSLSVFSQDERFSSMEAKKIQRKDLRNKRKGEKSVKKGPRVDHSAASIVLQSFLDSQGM